MKKSFPEAVLASDGAIDSATIRASVRAVTTNLVVPVALETTSTVARTEVSINEKEGDDEAGDGSREKLFRTFERAGLVLGIDGALLRAQAESGPAIARGIKFADLGPGEVRMLGPRNRHERRAAKAAKAASRRRS